MTHPSLHSLLSFVSKQRASHRTEVSAVLFCIVFALSSFHCAKKSEDQQGGTSMYANTVRGVKYVGSKKCMSCHADIYESYMKSEMGRSM